MQKGAEAVVVACNTATAVAINELRASFDIPIIGTEPAVKPALKEDMGKRILVIATPVTVREAKLKTLIDKLDFEHRVDLLPLPGLVTFAEANIFDGEDVKKYLVEKFGDYDMEKYGVVVLGCTHFNFFKNTYREILGDKIHFVDGNEGTIRRCADLMKINYHDNEHDISIKRLHGGTDYFISGREVNEADMRNNFEKLHERLKPLRKI